MIGIGKRIDQHKRIAIAIRRLGPGRIVAVAEVKEDTTAGINKGEPVSTVIKGSLKLEFTHDVVFRTMDRLEGRSFADHDDPFTRGEGGSHGEGEFHPCGEPDEGKVE